MKVNYAKRSTERHKAARKAAQTAAQIAYDSTTLFDAYKNILKASGVQYTPPKTALKGA